MALSDMIRGTWHLSVQDLTGKSQPWSRTVLNQTDDAGGCRYEPTVHKTPPACLDPGYLHLVPLVPQRCLTIGNDKSVVQIQDHWHAIHGQPFNPSGN